MISVRDLGFLRGYAVFDFLITYQRRPFLLAKHIDRLFNSARLLDLDLPWSKEQITEWVNQTLTANDDGEEKAIKIVVSGGVSDFLIPTGAPTIAILVDPRPTFPQEFYEQGLGVITVKHTRYFPTAKSNNYIEGVRQAKHAVQVGAIEPIYYDDNQVFETSTSNVFALIKGKLLTPKSNILPGLTRETLLTILKLNVPIEERDFSLAELLTADEVFLSASNKEVAPVTKIDGQPVGSGQVGKVTKEVMRQFREFTNSNNW